jgi:hypothetical protein
VLQFVQHIYTLWLTRYLTLSSSDGRSQSETETLSPVVGTQSQLQGLHLAERDTGLGS